MRTEAARDAWDERYSTHEYVWNVDVNQFVEAHLTDLDPGTAVDLAAGERVMDPYTINVFQGERAEEGRGMLRWDPTSRTWEEVPTIVDAVAGWLTDPSVNRACTASARSPLRARGRLRSWRTIRTRSRHRAARARRSNMKSPFPVP